MRAKNSIYKMSLVYIWGIIRKISLAIVSGISSDKITIPLKKRSNILITKEEIKKDWDKHYHRPVSRPAVEKQTLLKESKKQKGNFDA